MRTLHCWVLSKEVSRPILSLWYDVTWDWTPVSRTICEHSTHQANEPVHHWPWVECSPMIRETLVQSQVASYQRLKKWDLIPPCLTLNNIRYASRVKWSNPEKGVAPSPTPRCSSYWKGSLLVALDYGRQLYFTFLTNCMYGEDLALNNLCLICHKTPTKPNWGKIKLNGRLLNQRIKVII